MTDQNDEVEARSAAGLELLEHAFSEGGRVLEFKDGDERTVADITEHVDRLQEFWDKYPSLREGEDET